MKPRKCSRPWTDFELHVKRALEALGYVVQRDLLISGSQIDLYGELRGDLFVHRQIIECKSWAKEVGVEEVRQFAAVLDVTSSKSQPLSGLVVSRSGFTKTAREFGQRAGITLLTLADLAALSFDPDPIIEHTIRWFESDELGRSYVDLSCQVKEESSGTIYKPVEKFLDNFFAATKRPGVALLGNFGTGKTSLCKHYAYLLASRWKKGAQGTALPIYINLRDCEGLVRLETNLLETINETYSAEATDKGLRQWLSNGSTLLFLDGFDEMAAKLDRVTIGENLSALLRLTESRSVKVILSCRTHFFKTQVEEGGLGGLLRLYMCDWGQAELTDYIKKSMPEKAEASLDLIKTTYNLEELAKTPIFLNMIAATIGELGGSVNQAKLYQHYTDRWIQNQDYRSRVSPQQKRQFMEDLAYEMFSSQRPRIVYQQLPVRIREIFDLRDYESVAAFDRDIRTCSFLVRDEEGFYYFSHKSFMEFFVGLRLARHVKANQLDEFGKTELTYEVAGFFANYFETDWMHLVRLLIGGATVLCRANSALALGCLGFHEKTKDALILALETEISAKVQQRAVDALAMLGDSESVSAIARVSTRDGDLGTYCLRALEGFSNEPQVVEMYVKILGESSVTERICIVLSSIARQRVGMLRSSVISFIAKAWRRSDSDVTAALLTTIDALADLEFSLQVEGFIREALSGPHGSFAQQVKDELCKRARGEIEEQARSNRLRGLNYASNRSQLRSRFGYLITEDHASALLSALYPETLRRKTKRRSRR